MGSWGCPHGIKGVCQKVAQRVCDPGMKGCVLAGRYRFANATEKNIRLHLPTADAISSTPAVAKEPEIKSG